MSEEKDQLTNHEYDGIQEYDNPLPAWWLYTFLGTIIFAFLYYIHYELGGGPSLQEDLQAGLAVIEHQKKQAPQIQISATDIDSLIKNADLKVGDAQFAGKCAVCHGPALGGGIGPNLTDGFWIHGKGDALAIVKVIKEGVLEKGMPAWAAAMSDTEVVAVAALILSKQDSNPPDAKAPQGEKVR